MKMLFSIIVTFSVLFAFSLSSFPFRISSERSAERRKEKQLRTARIEARQHIAILQQNAIRLRKEPLVSRVLNLLSQLNNRKTHFLFELIQNADDNQFSQGETPTLNLKCRKDGLQLHCNEIGFSKANVTAICTAGSSSKHSADGKKNFIGEKGIGFKSVFAVADRVWISSKAYRFRLDGDQELGPITPIWDEDFPGDHSVSGTSMYFRFSNPRIFPDIAHELATSGPLILLFLRQIQHLEFDTSSLKDGTQGLLLRRGQTNALTETCSRNIVFEGENPAEWLTATLNVSMHSIQGQSTSSRLTKLVLVVPLNGQLQKSQSVYNFLPIGDFGFKFALHADFILLPNRREIAVDSPWNWAIKEAIPDAFLDAILNCRNVPELEWIWPKLVPDNQPQDSIFAGVEHVICSKLSWEKVLIAQNMERRRPIELFYVPREYRDRDGRPLCRSEALDHFYLSNEYSDDDWPVLKRLGVRRLMFVDFIRHLRVSAVSQGGIRRDLHWNIDIAQTLLAEKAQKETILDIPIIPLHDGRWISATETEGNLYYSSLASHLEIPPGLGINVIAPAAMQDSHRTALFVYLGAVSLTETVVQKRIIATHRNGPIPSITSLLSHVKFLFASNWSSGKPLTLHVLTTSKSIVPSSAVYIDCDQEFSASKYLKGCGRDAYFLDSIYLEQTQTKEDRFQLKRWLIDELGLSIIPRLFSCSPDATYQISEDFRHIFGTVPSSRWLLLLREKWEEYTDAMRQSGIDVKEICSVLGSQPVRCLNGENHPLSETCLLNEEWIENGGSNLPILQVDRPENPSWSMFLQRLGVITKPTVAFCLKWLQSINKLNLKPQDLMMLYFHLQGATEDISKIRDSFRMHALIYVPNTEQKWYTPEDCFWSAPSSIRDTPILDILYPEHDRLFRRILAVQNATPEKLLRTVEGRSKEERLKLFLEANELIRSSGPQSKKPTYTTAVFPIQDTNSNLHFLNHSSEKRSWFIADFEYLRRAFVGRVPLLEFDCKHVAELQPLIKYFGLESLFLSRACSSHIAHSGAGKISDNVTRLLRQRIATRLSQIPSEKELTQEMKYAFQAIEVHEAQQVMMNWIVRVGERNFESHPQGADGHVSIVNGVIHIFLEEESLKHEHFPMRVARRLAELYGLEDPECLGTINLILNEPDEDFVQRVLRKRGYAKQPLPPQVIPPRPPNKFPPQVQNDRQHDRNSTGQSPLSALQPTDLADNGKKLLSQIERKKANRLLYSIPQQPHNRLKTASIINMALGTKRTGDQGRVTIEKTFFRRMLPKPKDQTVCVNLRSAAFPEASRDLKDFKWSINGVYESQLSSRQKTTDRVESIQNDSIDSRLQRKLDYFVTDHDSFIVDPGIPDRSFRELRENSMLAGTDTAEVVFLFDSDSTAEYRKKIGAMDTLPANVSMCKRGFLTAFINLKSKAQAEITFHAEVLVSQLIQQMQGQTYCPNRHWTSRVREAVGHESFIPVIKPVATFEIIEPSAKMKHFIEKYSSAKVSNQFHDVKKIHIDVQVPMDTTARSLEFCPRRFEQARRSSIGPDQSESLYMILRISRPTAQCPQLSIIVDPWSQHVKGNIELFPDHQLDKMNIGSYLDRSLPCPTLALNSPYSYQPLHNHRSIRLLRLSGSLGDNMTLTGELKVVALNDPDIEYVAVSYNWGTGLRPFKLDISGKSIPLTASLYLALSRMMCVRKRPDWLWVDAVSINQEDQNEKASQIEMLHDIFQRAAEILAWIGNAGDESKLAIETILGLARSHKSGVEGSLDLGRDLKRCAAINALIARPWFRRTWIVQEVVFANNLEIFCGSSSITWEHFQLGVEVYADLAKDFVSTLQIPFIRHTESILSLESERRRYMADKQNRSSLLSLFDAFQHTKSSLLCDKLFALRALAAEAQNPKFRPNYHWDLTQVLHQYAKSFVEQGDALQVLCRAGASTEPSDLPSWVPQWTSSSYPQTITSWKSAHSCEISLCRSSLHKSKVTKPSLKGPDGRFLVVHGHAIDTVASIGTRDSENHHILSYLDEIFTTVESQNISGSKQELPDLVWKLAIGNAAEPPEGRWTVTDFKSSYRQLREYMKNGAHRSSDQLMSLTMEQAEKSRWQKLGLWLYVRTAMLFADALRSTVVSETSKGHVGLVPAKARYGDLIFVVDGATVPILLRQGPIAGQYWMLGECYFPQVSLYHSGDCEAICDEGICLY